MPQDQEASQRRRSLLRATILIGLKDCPASTIANLADRLDKTRPAVSRSMPGLKEEGLVMRKAQTGWVLTAAGVQEAEAAKEALAKTAAAAGDDLRTWSLTGKERYSRIAP